MEASSEVASVRVLFIFLQFLPNLGGTELTAYYYGRELVRRGHDVVVFAANALRLRPSNLRETESIEGMRVKRFRFVPLPFYDQFLLAPRLVSDLLSIQADVVQVFSWMPSFFTIVPYILAKARGIPLVLYPQCYPERSRYYPSILKRIVGVLLDRLLGPIMWRRADCVVALTRREADFYRKNGVRRVEVIRAPAFGAETSHLQPHTLRKRYGLSEDCPVILAVARIVKYKGIHILIKSAKELLDYIPDLKVLVVGQDWGFLPECIELSRELRCQQNIIFTGPLTSKELAAAYELCDMVVVPSYFEGYGLTVLEAWVHRKPVVVTTTVGLSEFISDETGIIVQPGDHASLSRAILGLLRNPKFGRTLGERGHQLLDHEFTLEAAVGKLENLYGSLLVR